MIVERLEPMTDAELLSLVKISGNVVGEYQDGAIQFHIDEVKEYMKSAGVPSEVIGSTLAKGCIARGVWDSWNPVPGQIKYSDMFYERVEHLRNVQVKEAEQ